MDSDPILREYALRSAGLAKLTITMYLCVHNCEGVVVMAMLRGFIGKLALPLLCLLVLNGCAQKIDASSKEALDASIEKVTKDMTDEERQRFRKAVGHIAIK